jgi:hypothetical protein
MGKNVEMKKIISVCLCICLMSGCDKSLSHGSPVNSVVKDTGSEGVSTHSLTSNTSNAPASELQPTPSPTLTPSPSVMSVLSAGSSLLWSVFCSVCKIGGYIVIFIVADWLLGYFVVNCVDSHVPRSLPLPCPVVVINEPPPNLVEDEESYSEPTPYFSSLSSNDEMP